MIIPINVDLGKQLIRAQRINRYLLGSVKSCVNFISSHLRIVGIVPRWRVGTAELPVNACGACQFEETGRFRSET